ncbi:MAG: hypothetical protein AAFY60_08250, partial [Myxococcota bacterium]
MKTPIVSLEESGEKYRFSLIAVVASVLLIAVSGAIYLKMSEYFFYMTSEPGQSLASALGASAADFTALLVFSSLLLLWRKLRSVAGYLVVAACVSVKTAVLISATVLVLGQKDVDAGHPRLVSTSSKCSSS